MKLTKAKLTKQLRPYLQEMGYLFFKDTLSGFQGLFAKKVGIDMYLTLGLTISQFYQSMFTGNFYLSKTTCIGSLYGDIPRQSYIRPGNILTATELSNYREKGSHLTDLWWDGLSLLSIKDFIRCINVAESRLLMDKELCTEIGNSTEVEILFNYSNKVKQIINNVPKCEYTFLPSKEIDNIPIKWFMAAEYVLTALKGIVNKNTVNRLASDAYRQFMLDSMYKSEIEHVHHSHGHKGKDHVHTDKGAINADGSGHDGPIPKLTKEQKEFINSIKGFDIY